MGILSGSASCYTGSLLCSIRFVVISAKLHTHLSNVPIADCESLAVASLLYSYFQRKMMAALVLTCRTGTPAKIMDEVFLLTIAAHRRREIDVASVAVQFSQGALAKNAFTWVTPGKPTIRLL